MKMKRLKRLAFVFLSAIYGLLILLTILGGLAPWMPISLFPLLQILPAVVAFGLPVHLVAMWIYKGKSAKGVMVAIVGVFLCAWIGLNDWELKKNLLTTESPHDLKLASYNIRNFNFSGTEIDTVLAVLKPLNADVICFQEFRNYRLTKEGPRATEYLAEAMGMPHFIHLRSGKYFQGTALFSRFPIQSIDTLFMPEEEANNGFLMTLEHPKGPIGIGNFHLTSFQFSHVNPDSNGVESKFRRLIRNGNFRIPQHKKLIQTVLAKTKDYPYPLILAADMNSAPHSHIPHQLHPHFKDAFEEAGEGLGWTFPLWNNLGVRIDYQWLNERVTPLEVKVIRDGQSDHFPMLGTYRMF